MSAYQKSIEKSLRDENEGLVVNTISNLKNFKRLNENLNEKINKTNDSSDTMGKKFDKSTEGIKGNMLGLSKTLAAKNSLVCWFIVLLFIGVFFIRRYIRLSHIDKEALVNTTSLESNNIPFDT